MAKKKEFDWKCKKCGKEIPVSEGHDEERCLKCAEEEREKAIEDLIPKDEEDS